MKSGIYKIACSVNKKFYIGSSNDIPRRWQEHKSYLRSGTHQNNHLQRAWNKYGEASFCFTVAEYVPENQLLDTEQLYLNKLPKGAFNQSKIAGSCGHDKLEKEYIVTFPDGKEVLIKNLNKFCRQNNIPTCGGLHQVARGEVNQCMGFQARYANQTAIEWQATIQRSSKSGPGWKGKYLITFPDKHTETVSSLTAFCRQNNLSQGSLRQTCIGMRKHHNGFKATYIREDI